MSYYDVHKPMIFIFSVLHYDCYINYSIFPWSCM